MDEKMSELLVDHEPEIKNLSYDQQRAKIERLRLMLVSWHRHYERKTPVGDWLVRETKKLYKPADNPTRVRTGFNEFDRAHQYPKPEGDDAKSEM